MSDTRPDNCTDDHLEYLDNLRESGITNMWAGGDYLMKSFGLGDEEAGTILFYWMHTFGKQDR